MTAFTPAQRAFYNALAQADPGHVIIVRKVLHAYRAGAPEPRPEDFGAPVGTRAWDLIEDAADAFDRALGTCDDQTVIRAALPVIDAVLAGKG